MGVLQLSLKKHIGISLLCLSTLASSLPVAAALISPSSRLPFKEKATQKRYSLSARKVINRGDRIWILPDSVIHSELSLVGDEFLGKLSPSSAKNLGVPKGTRLQGKITAMKSPKNFGRDALLKINIDALLLPDGRRQAVEADFITKADWKANKNANKGSIRRTGVMALQTGTELSAAALVGATDTVQYAGIGTAISTYGIVPAAGAAIGLGLGLAETFRRKGQNVASSGFDLLSMKLISDFEFLEELPEKNVSLADIAMATNYRERLERLKASFYSSTLNFESAQKSRSQSFGDFVLLTFKFKNNSGRKVYASDFILVSEKHFTGVHSNPLLSSPDLQAIDKNEEREITLAFSLGKYSGDLDYRLQLRDPISEEVILEQNCNLLAAL